MSTEASRSGRRHPPQGRIRCSAVFLDAGGVIVLPRRDLVAGALARVGVEIDRSLVPGAHYRAVRRLDSGLDAWGPPDPYGRAFCDALGVGEAHLPHALRALSELAERSRCGEILWSEQTPNALPTIVALRRAGVHVLVVTNSDGHARENLRDAAICQAGVGPGAVVSDVIDSGVVGSAKPDPAIFQVALGRAGVPADRVVHVGDTVRADVVGARAAGITPIHLDPNRACRAADHRHVRSLAGIWRHVTPAPAR